MQKIVAAVLAATLTIEPALAASAVTTANVNFRQGPGTKYTSMGTVPNGTSVQLTNCDDTGAWCSVTYDGRNGFISGSYLQLTEAEETTGWPRSYETDGGGTLILYQPQFTQWQAFTAVDALVAAEYLESGSEKPVFGVIGVSGRTVLDDETHEVIISDIEITQLDFSTLNREALTALTLQVGKLLPTESITVHEERITASLAESQRMDDVTGLNAEAPPVFVTTEPSILVQTDGEPILAPVKGVEGLQFVVNTNWDLLKIEDSGTYYLRDDKSWLVGDDPAGNWVPTNDLPDLIARLPDDDNWKEAHEAVPAQPFPDGLAPKVVYSDKPAEMIVFDGAPQFEDVPGTGLEWAANTDSDVFRMKDSGTWYILLSGRWFKSASLDGPWTFTTADLPADFLNLPEDAPYYAVRASVPNTSEAAQARLKASIPSTARVELGSESAGVAYDGDPRFEPIETTSLSYAVNTSDQVIKVGDKYYVLQDGVWFVGDSPNGPFTVADAVPEEIYTIPPSSPVYNVTYVRIYETEPGAVWFGYTMGYLTGYLAWGVLVYGSGWYHRPWYRPGQLPVYFPRPVTYGIGAFYNPLRGTYGRYGYAYGPRRGIAGGGVYNPRTGGYIRGAAVSGPLGQAGFIAAYNPRTGNRVVAGGARGIYGNWRAAGVTRGSAWVRSRDVQVQTASRWKAQGGPGQVAALGRRGDVYAGRDGAVYRQNGANWQKFENGRWSGVAQPAQDQIRGGLTAAAAGGAPGAAGLSQINRPAANRAANRPAANRPAANRPAASRPANRPAASRPAQRPAARPTAPAHLNRDARARRNGNHRVDRQRAVRHAPNRAGGVRRGRGGGGRRR